MRHRHNRLLELKTGAKKKTVFIRSLLTSLIRYGHVTTTSKRAKVLKSEADSFFSKLISQFEKYEDPKDARRECIRIIKSEIFGEDEGKKIINELLPKYQESNKKTGFVADYKVGFKKGDGAIKVLVKLI